MLRKVPLYLTNYFLTLTSFRMFQLLWSSSVTSTRTSNASAIYHLFSASHCAQYRGKFYILCRYTSSWFRCRRWRRVQNWRSSWRCHCNLSCGDSGCCTLLVEMEVRIVLCTAYSSWRTMNINWSFAKQSNVIEHACSCEC